MVDKADHVYTYMSKVVFIWLLRHHRHGILLLVVTEMMSKATAGSMTTQILTMEAAFVMANGACTQRWDYVAIDLVLPCDASLIQ